MLGIGVVGMPGAGKSIFSDAARSLGIVTIRMGDIVFEETEKKGLSLTPDNVGQIAIELREKWGKDIVAKKVIEKIKTLRKKPSIVVIEGLRSPEEVATFRAFFDQFVIIAIHAPPTVRYRRLMARKREDDSISIDILKKRDERELSFGIGNVIAIADEMLVNKDKTKDKFFNECLSLIKKIIRWKK